MYFLDHNLDLAGMFLGYFFINRNTAIIGFVKFHDLQKKAEWEESYLT